MNFDFIPLMIVLALILTGYLCRYTLLYAVRRAGPQSGSEWPELDECIQLLARHRGTLRFEDDPESPDIIHGSIRVGTPAKRRVAHFTFSRDKIPSAASYSLIPLCDALKLEGY